MSFFIYWLTPINDVHAALIERERELWKNL
jgi:hypothetical protein